MTYNYASFIIWNEYRYSEMTVRSAAFAVLNAMGANPGDVKKAEMLVSGNI
jgi:hypothetical protein